MAAPWFDSRSGVGIGLLRIEERTLMRRRAIIVGLAMATALLIAAAPASAQSVELAPFGGQSFNSPYYVTGAPGDPSRVFVVEGGRHDSPGQERRHPGRPPSWTSAVTSTGDSGVQATAASSRWRSPPTTRRAASSTSSTRGLDGATEQFDLRVEEFRRSAANPDVADPASGRIVLEIPRENLRGPDRPTTEASCSSDPTASSTSPSATATAARIRRQRAEHRRR